MTPGVSDPTGVSTLPTILGWLGIAWSARGLVAVTLPQPSETEALRQLPTRAERVGTTPGFDLDALKGKLARFYAGEAVTFDAPLDPTRGTDFQRRVWAITRVIPRGQTRTYGEIAREAGSPGAARAVGQAMAHNAWPAIVPRHRVVGHDGRLTGFRGGLALKQTLLQMEAVAGWGMPGLSQT